jgi:hypothetical protein
MISFRISMVPPKMAMTGLGAADSRVDRVLAVHEEDLASDQVTVQGSPGQIPSRKAVSSGGTPVSHSSTQAVITPGRAPVSLEVR